MNTAQAFGILLVSHFSVLPLVGCRAQTDAGAATGATKNSLASTLQDAGAPFGKLRLVDEIDCGAVTGARPFAEAPAGISQVETILGKACRVLPRSGEAKYFAYRIGQGKGLKAGAAYVLAVEFPEDKSRAMYIVNRGAEMVRGVRTGSALGDVLYTYTNNNNESLKIPLSGVYRSWKSLFFLHDRMFELDLASQNAGGEGKPRTGKPEDGFWIAITQSKAENDPLSAGAAVSRIRLYEVPDMARLNVPLRLPPAGLPQRHLFWREEMADGVIMGRKAEERGVTNQTDWFEYKARLMQFLGMNTFSKDLLEFGHNQGWDSGPTNDWFNASAHPQLWEDTLTMLGKYNFHVLPYYEYTGAVGQKGLGTQKRAMPLSGAKAYTHIHWTESRNVDLTDPDTLVDAKKVLDATIVRYKDKVKFAGAWFRPRPSQMAIGFADATLARFAREANSNAAVTREQLKSDETLLSRYYTWWFSKRREFLVALRDHLRANDIAGADILLTSDASEPGRSLNGPHSIVTDDVVTWTKLLAQPGHKSIRVLPYDQVVREDRHLEALTSPRSTWGEWEWQHSDPQSDPASYTNTEGVLLTYSYNRAYTASSVKAFDAFRTRSGLAAIMHHPLNEHSMEKSLGYIAADVEYAGPYSMLSEARAMAYGDPRYLGYLAASSFNRGFPEYVRAFNAAFLALPALPSTLLPAASADPDVVVRAIKTPQHGTYLAIVNVGLQDKRVYLTLPGKGKPFDATTGQPLTVADGKLALALYPCQLKAIRMQ
ncbi:MAG: hypothetical protein JWN98_387 [Abditibacteriota bacterium]|nr:hypothetical protein [Abditibacteriota bacterium]